MQQIITYIISVFAFRRPVVAVFPHIFVPNIGHLQNIIRHMTCLYTRAWSQANSTTCPSFIWFVSTSYTLHFVIYALAPSHCCPHHLNLFCYSIVIISFMPSLSPNSLHMNLFVTLAPCIHSISLMSVAWTYILSSLQCHIAYTCT